MNPVVVILAAGQGTRMKSRLPKVLHEAAGRPLLSHVLAAVAPLKPVRTLVVIGPGAELVRRRFAAAELSFVTQHRRRGTGHALLQVQSALTDYRGCLLVLNGDGPLLRTATLRALLARQLEGDGMTLLTCNVEEPTGLGRVVRDSHDLVQRIVEEKDAAVEEQNIREISAGIYAFDHTVFERARLLSNDNAAGEYYITDLIDIYRQAGLSVRAEVAADEREVLGVNDRGQLAIADRILRDRIRQHWLQAGVTMTAPEQTFIDDTVVFEEDVVLEQGVTLKGETKVGAGASVGAYAHLSDCRVEPGAVVPPHTLACGKTFS